jgi:hypothetical protein
MGSGVVQQGHETAVPIIAVSAWTGVMHGVFRQRTTSCPQDARDALPQAPELATSRSGPCYATAELPGSAKCGGGTVFCPSLYAN